MGVGAKTEPGRAGESQGEAKWRWEGRDLNLKVEPPSAAVMHDW